MTSSVSGNAICRSRFRILALSCHAWSSLVHWCPSPSAAIVSWLLAARLVARLTPVVVRPLVDLFAFPAAVPAHRSRTQTGGSQDGPDRDYRRGDGLALTTAVSDQGSPRRSGPSFRFERSALVGMEEADAIQRPFCEAVEPVDSALNRECRIAASSWGSPFLVITFVRREF